jgi:hypothetical protein
MIVKLPGDTKQREHILTVLSACENIIFVYQKLFVIL